MGDAQGETGGGGADSPAGLATPDSAAPEQPSMLLHPVDCSDRHTLSQESASAPKHKQQQHRCIQLTTSHNTVNLAERDGCVSGL